MDEKLFRTMIENQLVWRQAYYKKKQKQSAIKVLKDLKYTPKGKRNLEEIDNMINKLLNDL